MIPSKILAFNHIKTVRKNTYANGFHILPCGKVPNNYGERGGAEPPRLEVRGDLAPRDF